MSNPIPPLYGWATKEAALSCMEKQGRPASEILRLAREWDAHTAKHQAS